MNFFKKAELEPTIRRVFVSGETVTTEPLASDIPLGFMIEARAGNEPGVTIRIAYPGAPIEETEARVIGVVRAHIGRYSERLFALEVPIPSMARGHLEELVALIAKQLTTTLQRLEAGAKRAGPLMNYGMARQALELDDVPPPWMTEALKSLRSDRRDSRS